MMQDSAINLQGICVKHLGQVRSDEVKDLVQHKAEAESELRETYAKVADQYRRLAN